MKLDGASDFLDAVTAITRAGIPVCAQFGITPQTALRYGVEYSATPAPDTQVPEEMTDELVAEAKRLEEAGRRCSTSPTPGPSSAQRSPRLSPYPSSAGSVAVRGWTDGSAWRTRRSPAR